MLRSKSPGGQSSGDFNKNKLQIVERETELNPTQAMGRPEKCYSPPVALNG